MDYVNATMPDEEQIAGFMEPDDGSPVYMVNLLKYKEKAEYADGRASSILKRSIARTPRSSGKCLKWKK